MIGKSSFKSFTGGNGWQRGTFVRFTEGQSPHLEMKPECHLRVSSVQFYGLSYITQNSKKKLCSKQNKTRLKIEHHSGSFLSFCRYCVTKDHKSGESDFLFES